MISQRVALLLVLCGLVPGLAAAEPKVFEDYVLHCSACHGMDGKGVADLVPSLHGFDWMLEIPDGRAYLVRVPGVAQAPLSDARLARLVNWVMNSFSGTTPDPLYTAGEVGQLRASPLRDPLSARMALQSSIPQERAR